VKRSRRVRQSEHALLGLDLSITRFSMVAKFLGLKKRWFMTRQNPERCGKSIFPWKAWPRGDGSLDGVFSMLNPSIPKGVVFTHHSQSLGGTLLEGAAKSTQRPRIYELPVQSWMHNKWLQKLAFWLVSDNAE
jgi:hypothetical protein